MVTQRILKEGELSMVQKVEERIREICGVSKESFYGSPSAAKAHIISFGGCGDDLVYGFLCGMHIMQD